MSPLHALMPTHAALASSASQVGRASAQASSFQRLQDRIAELQSKHWPDQTVESKLKGAMREIERELIPDLADRSEWADVLIYFLGAAAKQGLTVHDLIEAGHAKMDINFLRKWGPPDRDGLSHHVEEGR